MALTPGTCLGPYEILAPLGAGGMGEVWRAKDTRIDRAVALKVLPEEFFESEEKGARFGREARTLASLNHPNVAVLYAFEEVEGRHILVMELLEGGSLRALVSRGPLPVRRALDIAEQVAQGLAAAHEKGIVHRDVKPENVFVTKDGHVKVLDFGLARAGAIPAGRDETESPTVDKLTTGGAVVGTVAYMSPEQARGLAVDHRSDQFSLGVVLYEMLAGKRPFKGASAAETLTAVIREEPEPLSREGTPVPAPVRWIVERCLAKEAVERYDSTRDLARELASCRAHLSETTSGAASPAGTLPSPITRWNRPLICVVSILIAAVLFATGAFVNSLIARPAQLRIRRLTFQRGQITTARFLPDGETVVYAAAWGGEPLQLYSVRLDSPESRPLGFKEADLLAVSRASELALDLGVAGRMSSGGTSIGTLALAPFSGGAPRALAENVLTADFSPDGRRMAASIGWWRLEYPLGTVLVESPGRDFWIERLRVSPGGDRVAFVQHPRQELGGTLRVVSSSGEVTKLTRPLTNVGGLAWSARGDEIWYSGTRDGARSDLMAASLGGDERRVLTGLGSVLLHDIARDGRVLVSTLDHRGRLFYVRTGLPVDRELSWFDGSQGSAISNDGKIVLLSEQGEAAGRSCTLFVRETDGGAPTKIETHTLSDRSNLSPDGRFVIVARSNPPAIDVIPVGTGTTRRISLSGFDAEPRRAGLMPDGKTVWFQGSTPAGSRGYWVTDLAGATPRRVANEDVGPVDPGVTPDGEHFFCRLEENRLALLPRDGGHPRVVSGVSNSGAVGVIQDELIAGSTPDGRFLYVYRRRSGFPVPIRRVDSITGQSQLLREISPPDRVGASLESVLVTPDGQDVVYNVKQRLGDLYVIEGLR